MSHRLQVRTVPLELLRPGPPHNQLLSPLTEYLGICGQSGAGVVRLPYEHAVFERRLAELRYDVASEERLAALRSTGVDVARILASVPGLAGSLTSDVDLQGSMIHLRITLSASELALLPFELSKLPTTVDGSSEVWLGLQTRPPVCITRHIRTVSSEGVQWPHKPRILFVAASTGDIPFVEHRKVLEQAIAPFSYPNRDEPAAGRDERHTHYGELLTVIRDASLDDVVNACRSTAYTHVHVLAHGAADVSSKGRPFGLRLCGRRGGTDPDIVSGERFATALATVDEGRIHRPTVVSIASCDSGLVTTVVDPVPGGSFAHTLHQSGIPLVVASQFPLTKAGSVTVAQILYEGLLSGQDPWVLLHRLRSELHARYGAESHDWASMVVYEALPNDIERQMETVRYEQGRQRLNAALERVDLSLRERRDDAHAMPAHERLHQDVDAATGRLPSEGAYAMECLGLRGSASKRLAQATYERAQWMTKQTAGDPSRERTTMRKRLEQAVSYYSQAARLFMLNAADVLQRRATLHWVLVQEVCLRAVLGQQIDAGLWEVARVSAEAYKDHESLEERAWAHASLAELYLLRAVLHHTRASDSAPELASTTADVAMREDVEQAIENTETLAQLYPWGDPFPIKSTRRQFRRYEEWWGDDLFIYPGQTRAWAERGSVRDTARRLKEILLREDADDEPAPLVPTPPHAQPDSSSEPGIATLAARTSGTGTRPRSDTGRTFLDVHMLPAQHGDCLWIEYGEDPRAVSRVLIDCGTRRTTQQLLGRIGQIGGRKPSLELFVLTHIDDDHIGGAIPLLEAELGGLEVGDVWFNGWKHLPLLGAVQGERFSTLIEDLRLPWNRWRDGGAIVVEQNASVHVLPGGLSLTLLSPGVPQLEELGRRWEREVGDKGLTPGQRVDAEDFLGAARETTSTDVEQMAQRPFKSDTSAPNGSSIALLAEFAGRRVLLAADAHPPVLVESIKKLLRQRQAERLEIDALKVSHHASHGNTSRELLELLDCPRYLISTSGAGSSHHPHRETVSRIIKFGGQQPKLHFNYISDENKVWARPDLQERYNYRAVYPESGEGLRVPL